jgi:hypothetical protein
VRRRDQDFEFVYVNQDGSARELSPGERAYLSTEFSGADGARPYIKTTYESRDGWGSLSGFILRSGVPSRTVIEPVHPDYDALEKQLRLSHGERFEVDQSKQLAEQRRREELAKIKR